MAFDASRLDRLSGFLQRAVDSNRIGGAVALVVRDGRTVYERAVGFSDRESGKRMAPDALFRIASQTKALTSVAVMILVEEGRIALSNPVSRFIPAFDTTWVLAPGDTGMAAVRATRRITIRDLLTQTAGISYGTDARLRNAYAAKGLGPAAGWGWYTADKDEPVCATMERLATLPFARQPGEAWVYGYATDILGCVVERASGMTLDDFFHARISGPLGMRDTWFFVPPAARPRLVTVYASRDGAAVRAPDGALGQGHYDRGPMRNFAGGAGLVSTARDYARFLQMLLNGGALDGVRILSPKSVDVMTSNQTGSLYHPQQSMSFGLGFSIVERPGADNSLSSVGTWGWGGAYGSQYRVDPRERLVMVLMMNQMPNQSDVATKFSTLVYQALVR
ncbi:MAG TPA: serine hydrolase domain-containing protein [Burkholderiales bacterium]|nr:serine hydrolase domain-containing protein [Burkholderiales bacterium]